LLEVERVLVAMSGNRVKIRPMRQLPKMRGKVNLGETSSSSTLDTC
jgi:hypothetical protein